MNDDERDRLAALRAYRILDTEPERAFHDLLAAPGYWLQILEGATTGWYYMMNNSRVLTVAGPDLTVRMRVSGDQAGTAATETKLIAIRLA